MIFYIIAFILTLFVIFTPKKLDEASIQKQYQDLLRENYKENQMTELPALHSEVVEFTKREMRGLHPNVYIEHLLK